MTIALTTSPGGIFRRIGRIGAVLNGINAFRGTADLSGASIISVGVGVNNIRDQFLSTNSQLIDGLYSARDGYRGVHGSLANYLKTLAANVVITMADDDVRLVTKDLPTALKELIRQMIASSDSVDRPTVSVTVTAGSANTGTGVVAASVTNPNGTQMAYPFNETVDVTCTGDAQSSTATSGSEPFSARGDNAQSDELMWDWEKGSACSTSVNAVNANEDVGTNYLVNSSFEDYTVANTPDSWTVLVGTVGTHILAAGAGSGYAGATSPNGLKFTGDGSNLTSIVQPFAAATTASGSTKTLLPSTVYAMNVWLKKSGAGLLAGVLDIDLVDSSNATINDAAGTANRKQVTLSGLTTSYAATNAFFRTPAVLPSTVKLRVRLSTAATNTESVFIDHLSLTPATRLYAGGPFIACFSGATAFVIGDTFAVAVSNDYGGEFQRLFQRLFNMRALGLQIPDAVSETIVDSLVA